jgi:hypothetical protein
MARKEGVFGINRSNGPTSRLGLVFGSESNTSFLVVGSPISTQWKARYLNAFSSLEIVGMALSFFVSDVCVNPLVER